MAFGRLKDLISVQNQRQQERVLRIVFPYLNDFTPEDVRFEIYTAMKKMDVVENQHAKDLAAEFVEAIKQSK